MFTLSCLENLTEVVRTSSNFEIDLHINQIQKIFEGELLV